MQEANTVTPQDGAGTGHGLNAAAEAISQIEGFEDEAEEGQEAPATEEDEEGQPLAALESDSDEQGEQEASDSEEEPITYDSLEALAEAAGMGVEDVLNLSHSFRAADGDVTASLKDLRAAYQKDADYRRKTSQLSDERKAMQQHYAQKVQAVDNHSMWLGQALGQLKHIVAGEINTPEMQQLRATDPGAWAARTAEIDKRANGVDQLLAQVANSLQQTRQQQQQEQQQLMHENMEREQAALLEAIPDWSTQREQQLTQYLTSFGIPQEQLQGGLTAVQIVIADKARQFDELQKVGKQTKRKLSKLPKATRPGKAQPANAGQAKRVRDLEAAHRKTGSLDTAAALIGARQQE